MITPSSLQIFNAMIMLDVTVGHILKVIFPLPYAEVILMLLYMYALSVTVCSNLFAHLSMVIFKPSSETAFHIASCAALVLLNLLF